MTLTSCGVGKPMRFFLSFFIPKKLWYACFIHDIEFSISKYKRGLITYDYFKESILSLNFCYTYHRDYFKINDNNLFLMYLDVFNNYDNNVKNFLASYKLKKLVNINLDFKNSLIKLSSFGYSRLVVKVMYFFVNKFSLIYFNNKGDLNG
jgi:hypothetical protein